MLNMFKQLAISAAIAAFAVSLAGFTGVLLCFTYRALTL